jgi:hypothetical protein
MQDVCRKKADTMSDDSSDPIKNKDTYDALREEGASKSKAAAIANAQARDDMSPSKKGGKAAPYEKRTKEDLLELARERGIECRSKMSKDELINALRNN